MFNLKILIVEDSPVFATELEMLVKSIGYLPVLIVDNSEDAIDSIQNNEPDLILMDIDIKGEMSGMEVAEKINHLEIPIIFITSFGNHALYERAKKIKSHVNFLVKPLDEITLRSAIESTLRNLSAHILGQEKGGDIEDFILNDCFFIKKNNALQKVPINSITHVESDGNYSRIFAEKLGSFFIKKSLSKIAAILPDILFIRIHRKYLINARFIEQIELSSNEISICGNSLPVGRTYKETLLGKLKKLG